MNRFRRTQLRAQRGMVLLEVLLALTVFAVVSLGLVMALDQSLDAAKSRNEAGQATRGLRNQLDLLHQGPLVPGSRDLPGDGSVTGTSYHLDVEAVPMLDQHKAPMLGLYRATITAMWNSANHPEKRSISELVYQP